MTIDIERYYGIDRLGSYDSYSLHAFASVFVFVNLRFKALVPWYSRLLKRLNDMPVMGSSLEWTTFTSVARTDFNRLRGNELSLQSLY